MRTMQKFWRCGWPTERDDSPLSSKLSSRWPTQPPCLHLGALPPPSTRLSPRSAIQTPSPPSCIHHHALPPNCPCYCTCTVQGSLGPGCGTSSLKAPPAPRLWSCTLDVRSQRSHSSSVSWPRRPPLAGPPSACTPSCVFWWAPRAPCPVVSTSPAATSPGTAWAAPGLWLAHPNPKP